MLKLGKYGISWLWPIEFWRETHYESWMTYRLVVGCRPRLGLRYVRGIDPHGCGRTNVIVLGPLKITWPIMTGLRERGKP